MLNFRKITVEDYARLHPYFYRFNGHGSEFSFANLFFWGDQKVAFLNDTPVFLSLFDGYTYPYPVTAPELIDELDRDAKERGIRFRLFGLTAEECKRLEAAQPGRFLFHPVRDSFDYVYSIDRLADLHGKHLQSKRNHCNRFEEAYPDYRVLPLTVDLLDRCREFTEHWYTAHTEGGPAMDYRGERRAIGLAFDNFEALHMEGILLEMSDGMAAFSMGNRIREDTFDVNFEKALPDVNGAYPMVNREFARLLRGRYPELKYLNREDDMGIEGLRRAKESYEPDILLEKYLAEEKE